MRRRFVLSLALVAALPATAAAHQPLSTKLSVTIDAQGRASAKLTVTNRGDQPVCFPYEGEYVFLSAADGSMIGNVVARPSTMWPADMPVVWDGFGPRTFTLPLNTDTYSPGIEQMRRAAKATYDFSAYDCAELFADRVHARPRYQRKLSTVPVIAN